MRRLTIGGALLGSVVTAALLTPGAQATEVVGNADVGAFRITGGGGSGNDVVLGTTDSRTITVKLTADDDSGIKSADFTGFLRGCPGLQAGEESDSCGAGQG
ncbi:hypothetical protein ACIBJF_34100 [Streptomyces sp. NPDC050743]|uniref:hypothetical protein n=1 Tax=Streptomyces sp. NPDC050743 TaxID=3365634 RepID=UPI0037B92E80